MAKAKRDLRAHLRKTEFSAVGMCVRLGAAPNSAVQRPHSAVLKALTVRFKDPLRGRIMRFRAVRNPKACLPLKGGAFVTAFRDKLTRKPKAAGVTYFTVYVIGPVPAFRRHPGNVLGRVLHIAGFAVDAILRVDLKPQPIALGDHLVDLRRAISLRGLRVFGKILGDWDARVGESRDAPAGPRHGWCPTGTPRRECRS